MRRCLASGSNAARAEAEAAVAVLEARRAHSRLRDAIDILPQGIVFLDAEGRYILWNQQYAEIYRRSADLFEPGVRLEDTLRDRRRARRLSRSHRPRGGVDRGAARTPVSIRRARMSRRCPTAASS